MMKKVPKLRFPEFEGEWKEKKIGEIFDFYTTNSYSRSLLNYNSGEAKNIHYGDIHMKFPTIVDCNREDIPYINFDVKLDKIKKDSYCKDGDIVIADASEDYADIGKTIELKNIGESIILAGLHTLLGRDNKGITVDGYRGYMMSTDSIHHQVRILAVGSKVLGISKGNIVKVIVNIPSKKEQEKIASFFSLIDQKIEKQQQKIEEFQVYKKGMMQKIFSQEIRFKDENDYLKWKEGTIKQIVSEDLHPIKKPEDGYWRLGLRSHGKGTFHKYVSNPKEVNMDMLYEVHKYSLIVNITFAWEHAIAITDENDHGKLVSHRFPTYSFNNNAYYGFYKYFLLRPILKYQLANASPGGAGRNRVLNKKQFLEIPVVIPALEEQQKIAKFLTELDIKIEKEQEKLQQLQQWKKGFLQQMFV